ncbi:DUF3592 domain-containing protein [Solemya velesiana gill symbiont]|uniref:DUF3592 domain-containing protein n=1 Tax=Solemya velesiana gill symbiont TaxID=1918948 RepID=UPI003CCC36F4
MTYSQLDAKTLTRRIGSGTVHTNLLFRADIRYEYSVAGTSYSGTDVTIERIWTQDKAVAKSTLQRYPIGARVTVYYDPSTPRRSVLEPGMKGGWPAQIELGVIFCVVSLIGFAIASYLKRSGS